MRGGGGDGGLGVPCGWGRRGGAEEGLQGATLKGLWARRVRAYMLTFAPTPARPLGLWLFPPPPPPPHPTSGLAPWLTLLVPAGVIRHLGPADSLAVCLTSRGGLGQADGICPHCPGGNAPRFGRHRRRFCLWVVISYTLVTFSLQQPGGCCPRVTLGFLCLSFLTGELGLTAQMPPSQDLWEDRLSDPSKCL